MNNLLNYHQTLPIKIITPIFYTFIITLQHSLSDIFDADFFLTNFRVCFMRHTITCMYSGDSTNYLQHRCKIQPTLKLEF